MKLTCDLCGGTLEMKNGSAVCQGCGLTYSMETLREKMGNSIHKEPNAAPASVHTARVASAVNTNHLNLAVLEFNNKNYAKVITICDQVLTSDYSNKDAWQLKIRSSNVQAGVTAYQAYFASQQTEEGRIQANDFGKKHFSAVKLGGVENETAVLSIFPDIANRAVNQYLSKNISDWNKCVADAKAAQEWENRNKPDSEYEYNEKTIEFLRKARERAGWLNSYVRQIEEYYNYSKKANSDIGANLADYCQSIASWAELIMSFKRWKGEFHHRETVSVYTTKYYYHKYQLVPMLYDTSWEYAACSRCKDRLNKIRISLVADNERKAAQKAAEEKKRIAEYWATHPEEKNELDTAKADLQEQIEKLEKQFLNSYEVRTRLELLENLEEEKKQLQARRNALGLFSFKEKKAVDAEISNKEVEISRAKKQIDELEYKKNDQVKDLKFKIQKINDRLCLIGVKPKL